MSATSTHTFRFSPEEQQAYDRDGFVLRHDVFSPTEVAQIVHECEALVEDLVARRRHKRYHVGSYTFEPDREIDVTIKWEGDTDVVHGIEPFAHMWPPLETWALDERFLDGCEYIIGDDHPRLFTEKLNLKRPFHGGVNPLHQDYPYWIDAADDATRVATAMLFLDDSTLENGCLQVVPGSHINGQEKLRTDQDFFGNLEMDPEPFAGAELLPVEVRAGAVLFFGAFLVHMSQPNRSDKERRALLFSYCPDEHRHMRDVFREKREQQSK